MKIHTSAMTFPHLEAARPIQPSGPCRGVLTTDEKKFKVAKRVNGKPVMKTLKSGPRKGQTVVEEIQVILQIREVIGHGVTYRTTSRSNDILVQPQVGKAYRMSVARFRREAPRLFGETAERNLLHLVGASPMLSRANSISHRKVRA